MWGCEDEDECEDYVGMRWDVRVRARIICEHSSSL